MGSTISKMYASKQIILRAAAREVDELVKKIGERVQIPVNMT